MVDRQYAGWARVLVRQVVMRMFRRKIAARRLNASASARRRQRAQEKGSAAAENSERHLGSVIPAARLPWADLQTKRAARDNQVRALINPGGRPELEGLLQVSAPQASQRVESPQAKRVVRDNKVRALINPGGRPELEGPLQMSAPRASQRVESPLAKRVARDNQVRALISPGDR